MVYVYMPPDEPRPQTQATVLYNYRQKSLQKVRNIGKVQLCSPG